MVPLLFIWTVHRRRGVPLVRRRVREVDPAVGGTELCTHTEQRLLLVRQGNPIAGLHVRRKATYLQHHRYEIPHNPVPRDPTRVKLCAKLCA